MEFSTPRGIPGSSISGGGAGGSEDELVLKNELAASQSPYVRAHASNPVAWQMWTPETLALAKRHNRVLFVSIGYSACHWCHVMERESFENEDIAKLLNRHFIPIKVDREERPDIDRIYMNFVQATTGSGGWPLNVFLTPDLEPVFGGTYWPGPRAASAMKDQIGFVEILEKIVQTWKEQRAKFLASAKEIMPKLKEFTDEGLKGAGEGDDENLDVDLLEEAYQQFVTRFDPVNGGFGLPPKFPVPTKLAFLLRLGTYPRTVRDVVGERECENAKTMVLHTLRAMGNGGIHDQIGHGFSRYSVTADWSLPHFEKMLYDNAQLLGVYLDAWLVTKEERMLEIVEDVGNYLCDDVLAHKDGGFCSSEGADSLYRKEDTDKREGAFYVWSRYELDAILGKTDSAIVAKYYNVHRSGNVDPEDDAHDEFINQNVLAISSTPEQLSKHFSLPVDQINSILASARTKLRAHRDADRPRPNLDDKIVTAWNGLAIVHLSRAANALKEIRPEMSKKFLTHAIRATEFVRKNLYDSQTGQLWRVYRSKRGDTPGFADDYAFLIQGLLALYEATFDPQYLRWADELQKTQISHFLDSEHGGFFSTMEGAGDMILRLKDGLDSQEPSTNGISASNLFRLSTLLDDDTYATIARRTIHAFSAELLEHPSMFASMMSPIVASTLGMRSILLAGDPEKDEEVKNALKDVRGRLLTNTTVVVVNGKNLKNEDGKWLLERNIVFQEMAKRAEERGKSRVQVCEGSKCLEAFDLGDLSKALEEMG